MNVVCSTDCNLSNELIIPVKDASVVMMSSTSPLASPGELGPGPSDLLQSELRTFGAAISCCVYMFRKASFCWQSSAT